MIKDFEKEQNWNFTKSDEIFEKDFFLDLKKRYGSILLKRYNADGWTSDSK
jgi:hypothetical protein